MFGKRSLARFLDVSEGTVDRMLATGTGPKAYKIRGVWRFSLKDVTTWLESQVVCSERRPA